MKRKIVAILLGLIILCFTGCIGEDTNPPESVKVTQYGMGLLGNTEWINSNTEFSFFATDDYSGVNRTEYRTWHNESWSSWINYTAPFSLSGTGKHYIEFYSTDNAGNEEVVTNQTHYLDDTPPVTIKNVTNNNTLFCGKLFFNGTENITFPNIFIAPEVYNNTVYCNQETLEGKNIYFYFEDVEFVM